MSQVEWNRWPIEDGKEICAEVGVDQNELGFGQCWQIVAGMDEEEAIWRTGNWRKCANGNADPGNGCGMPDGGALRKDLQN